LSLKVETRWTAVKRATLLSVAVTQAFGRRAHRSGRRRNLRGPVPVHGRRDRGLVGHRQRCGRRGLGRRRRERAADRLHDLAERRL
jgi:hypothetical protein